MRFSMFSRDSSQAASTDPAEKPAPPRGRRLLWLAACVVVLIAAAGSITVWYWPAVSAGRLCAVAEKHLLVGEIGPAWRAAAEAARIAPQDVRPELVRARCALYWQEPALWRQALDAAVAKHLSEADRPLYEALDKVAFNPAESAGPVPVASDPGASNIEQSLAPGEVARLIDRGALPADAVTAVVGGFLARGDVAAAEKALDRVPKDWVDEAQLLALRGQIAAARGDRELAADAFRAALAKRSAHEPAFSGLARIAEEQYELAAALEYASRLYGAAPERETSRATLARVLRKLGRLNAARQILAAPDEPAEASVAVALERGEIEYEAGNYPQAAEWFDRADLAGPHIAETLRAAASNLAQSGQREPAEALFTRIDDAQGLGRLESELTRRLSIDPGDPAAAAERQLLSARGSLTTVDPPAAAVAGGTDEQHALYMRHCAACHGNDGNGNGPAAQHVFPRPRNLRQDAYRLIRTTSLAPTRDDIDLVIRQGIPGTSMQAFDKLSDGQRSQLADYVLLLRQAGREQLAEAADQGPKASGPARGESAPGEVLAIPPLGAADEEVLARGRALYVETGCAKCHGDDGTAAGLPPLVDDEGESTVARDLVRDPLKGGPSLESLYRRICLGMPGTPHPAAATLADADLAALAHYCQSLGQEPKRTLTNYERSQRAARGVTAAAAD
jgi:mono/diheme cytochrome c family protein/tetratricopeptide (TPR) repeat protein